MRLPKKYNYLPSFIYGFVFGFLVIYTLTSRLELLSARTVHTDEAENAFVLGHALQGTPYTFNPEHHHGPTLHYMLLPVAKIVGMDSYRSINMDTLRKVILMIAVATSVSFLAFIPRIGFQPTLYALVFTAVSSLIAYYSCYVIHEPLLALLSIWILASGWYFIRKPSCWSLTIMAVATGCLLATKITSVFLLSSWGVAILIVGRKQFWDFIRTLCSQHRIKVIAAVFLCIFVTCALYSGCFTNPKAIGDAILSPFVYSTDPAHHKPWHYFISTFILPLNSESQLVVVEYGLLIFAVVGALRGFFIPKSEDSSNQQLARFLTISTIFQITCYSLIPYKTPWLMLVSWYQLALLAGLGLGYATCKATLPIKFLTWVVLGLTLAHSLSVNVLIKTRFHSDPRNPLAYSPTSSNIENLPRFIEHMPSLKSIHVIGDDIWPLPWYLRHQDGVEFDDTTLPISIANFKAVIVTEAAYEKHHNTLSTYDIYPYTLRPNFPVYFCLHKSLRNH